MIGDILYEAIEKEAKAIENDIATNSDEDREYKNGVRALLRAVKRLLVTEDEDY
jgi:hypothetical protein